MEFYVYLNGSSRGPFTRERVRSFLADGLVQASDLVSTQSNGEWKPARALNELEDVSAASATVAPPLSPVPQAETAPVAPPAPPAIPTPQVAALTRGSLGSYARSTLAPDEVPCFKTSLHWIIFVRFASLALLVFLLLAIPFAIAVQALTGSEVGWFVLPLPAFLLVPPAIAFSSSELVVTDRRILIKTGIVHRRSVEMFLSKVESIAVDQGFLGRMLDFGSVVVRGTGGFEQPFEAIAHPIVFRDWVQRLQQDQAGAASP